jgi:DNA-binding NarL/FixJ family response regulator
VKTALRGANTKISPREAKVLELMAGECLSNKEIAFRLNLTEGTVKEYCKSVYLKLGIYQIQGYNSRALAVKWVLERGIAQ